VEEIATLRAAALRHPRAGVGDADIYADEAFLLGHLAEIRQLLGQMEAQIGEPADARLPLGWMNQRTRPPARLRRRSASAGPGTGSRNTRRRRPAP
jgi:hypothetical protein